MGYARMVTVEFRHDQRHRGRRVIGTVSNDLRELMRLSERTTQMPPPRSDASFGASGALAHTLALTGSMSLVPDGRQGERAVSKVGFLALLSWVRSVVRGRRAARHALAHTIPVGRMLKVELTREEAP